MPVCAASAQLAGYRWLINLTQHMVLDNFDFEMALRLWTEVAGGLHCCFDCGDDEWCRKGLDYWMAGIVIFLLKFYGHGNSRADRLHIRYIRATFLDSPESALEMLEFELEMMDMLHPVLFRIQNDVANV